MAVQFEDAKNFELEIKNTEENGGRRSIKRKSLSEQAAMSFTLAKSNAADSGGLTTAEVVMSLITAIIGAGVVALPGLMQLSGWYLGPPICIFTGLCFMEVGCFMHDAITRLDEGKPQSEWIKSFDDFGYIAMGDLGVKLVQTAVTAMFFGYMICFQVLIGKNVRLLLPMDVCSKPRAIYCIASASPILICLAMLKDMTMLAKLMPIGTFVALAGCVLICYKGVADAKMRNETWRDDEAWTADNPLYNYWPPDMAGLGTVIAVLFAAFAVMGTVPTIRGQMKDRSAFPSAFRLTIVLVLVLYTACMTCAYYGYGNFIKQNVVQSMRQFPKDLDEARDAITNGDSDFTGAGSVIAGNAMALMVTINLLISFPVYFQCVIGSIERFNPEAEHAKYGTTSNKILRALLVLLTCSIAMVVPYFRSVMAVLASVCCSCNNVFFPLLFSYKTMDISTSQQIIPLRKAFHGFIVLFAVVCAVLGLLDSVSGLVQKLSHPTPEDTTCLRLDTIGNGTNITNVIAW